MRIVFAVFLLCVAACGTQAPPVNSVADGIAVAAATIETAAQQTAALCRHERPGGPCASDAFITTATRDRIKRQLQDALEYVSLARVALITNEPQAAADRLDRANLLLTLVRDELARAER